METKSLGQLQPSAVPPEMECNRDIRDALEKWGYVVRKKLKQGAKSSLTAKTKRKKSKRKQKVLKLQTSWVVLKTDEMRQLYERHRQLIIQTNARLQTEQEAGGLQPEAAEVGVFFWYDENGGEQLSDNNLMGLRTAMHIGKLQTHLYTYSVPANLPEGIVLRQAEKMVPLEMLKACRARGAKIAHVADLVRLKGMTACVEEGATFVWFLDLDTHWVTSAKAASSQQPAAAFQHVIASMQGSKGSQAGAVHAARKGMLQFLVMPQDHWYAVTPFRVTSRSPLLPALLEELEVATQTLLEGGDWNYSVFMEAYAQGVRKFGLQGAIVSPIAFSPVSPYSKRRCLKEAVLTRPNGLQRVSVKSIFQLSMGVNTYWQSGKHNDAPALERGSHKQVASGSLWCLFLEELRKRMVDTDVGSQPAHASVRKNAGRTSRATKLRLFVKCRDPFADVLLPLPWSELQPAQDSRAAVLRMESQGPTVFEAWMRSGIQNRCQLIRHLGEGAYGKVFLAKYRNESGMVAVKVASAKRLHQPISTAEISLLARAQTHPNIVMLIDYFHSPLFSVIVLEKLDSSIQKILRSQAPNGAFLSETALHVTLGLATGVQHLHARGILHRDLHLGNVLSTLVCLQPGQEVRPEHVVKVCICDLGQGCDVQGDAELLEKSPHVGANIVTPPECFLVSRSSKQVYYTPVDVWAIGVNLVVMLKGWGFVPEIRDKNMFVQFFSELIGPMDAGLVKRLRWCGDLATSAPSHPLGLQLDVGSTDTTHLQILKWDPRSRPSTGRLQSILRAEREIALCF